MQKVQAIDTQQEISKRASVQVMNYFDKLEDELRLASRTSNIANLDHNRQNEVLFRMRSYKNKGHRDFFDDLVLLDGRGMERARRSRNKVYAQSDLKDRSRSEEFRYPIKTGEVFYSPVSFNKEIGEPFITMAMPLPDIQPGLKNGVLIAEVRLRDIWDLSAGLPVGDMVFMLNQDGMVVAHKETSPALRGTHFKIPEEAGINIGLLGTAVVLAGNRITLGSQTFHVVSEKPLSEALRPVFGMALLTGILFVGAIAGVLWYALTVKRRLLAPLEDITGFVLSISEKDPLHRPDTGNDSEFDSLRKAFDSMTAQIQNMTNSLEEHKAELNLAEERLAEERARLSVTLGSIGDAVIATDTKGTVLLINKAAEELTGWTQNKAKGKALTEVFHVVNERADEDVENDNTVLMSSDGTERIIVQREARIRDSRNSEIGSVLIFRDITETHKIEKELLNAKKLESIAILAAGIAHEINNPLTNASLNLQVLKGRLEDSILDREILNKLGSVQRNMDRASMIAKELLVFSRQRELELKPVNILNIITDVLVHIKYRLNNIKLHKDLLPVPNINGDPVKLGQVLINILNNSLEAMPQGGDIFISTSHYNGRVEVSIADTGTGIPEELISRVFDPFFTTKEIGVGTGLGLAICYGIINQHKGNTEISSSFGKGTEVRIKLPARTN